jgi:adenosylcobinamide-GDP ribazoletransferase
MSIVGESSGGVPRAAAEEPAARLTVAPPGHPDAWWRDLRAAVAELTIFGGATDTSRLTIGRSARFYPAVGLLIGLMTAAFDWVLRLFLSQEIASVLIVGALALLSAGRQLDGFANTADGVIGFRGREWAIATIRDRRIGSSGAAAIAFLLILKVRSLDLLSDANRFVGVALAPTLARTAIVALAFGARLAGSAIAPQRFDPAIRSRELAIDAGCAAAVTLLLAGTLGLPALVLTAALVAAMRWYLDRRLGGVTAQSLDAGAEIVETMTLLVFALGS